VNDDPTNPGPNVRHDYGGWISGPCLDVPEHTEPVAAGDVQPGDTVLIDGMRAEVTDVRAGDYWLNTGRHGPGVAIGWRSESSSGVMFRRAGDTLRRVRP
jgi:hypothetical protein